MSDITTITYAQSLTLGLADGESKGYKFVNKTNNYDSFFDFTGSDYKKISINPLATEENHISMGELKLANDITIKSEYYLSNFTTEHIFDFDYNKATVNIESHFYDKEGNEISSLTTDSGGIFSFPLRSTSPIYTKFEGWEERSIYWFSSRTLYNDYDSHPAVAGDSPLSIELFTNFIVDKPLLPEHVIGAPPEKKPLAGELKNFIEFDTYYRNVGGGLGFSRQEDLDAFLNALGKKGNGDPVIVIKDPVEDDPSGPGGGNPGYNPNQPTDPIDIPNVPTISAIKCGIVTMYNPSVEQMRNLGGKLWSDDFINSIKKILNNPYDGIVSFSMLPFNPDTSGSINCKIGNYDSEVSMPLVSNQYKKINCGSITIEENWGSALDYSPYTKLELFLPFVGIIPLKAEDIMNKTINVQYNADCLTGSAIAFVKCGASVLYTFNCNLAYQVPITGSDMARFYGGIMSTVLYGASALASGSVGGVGGALNSAINTMTSKGTDVHRSGSLSGNGGCLGTFTPYIIKHMPIQSLPSKFDTFKGYPSNITGNVNSFSNYLEVEYCHLDGVSATDEEKREIESLLKAGIITS